MSKEDQEYFFKYYFAQYRGAKTVEDRNAWANLIAAELPKLIDSIADIEPMLALHGSRKEGK